ncbi:unnamed protein product [Aphanomyces euteiches]
MVLLNRLPHEVKAAVVQNRELTRHGNRLSSRLEELAKVISILSMWVFLQAPHEGLKPKPTMMESTLLGNEECRKYGYQWLCEKVLYMALAAHPYSPFGGRIDDDLIVSMHLGEDHTGTKIEAAQGIPNSRSLAITRMWPKLAGIHYSKSSLPRSLTKSTTI